MPTFHLPRRSLAIMAVAVLTAVVSGVTAAVLRTDIISLTSVPVTWTGLVKTAVSNGILSNVAPSSDPYYAGAHSTQMITAGDGWLEFRKGDSKRDVFVGLSSDTSDAVAPCNTYGLEFYETYVEVRENCVYRKDTSYRAGDRFRIALQGGMVKYSRNGKVFYSSTTSPSYPLVADVMFNVSGARIYGANIATNTSTVAVASPSPTPLSSPTPVATAAPVPSASATPTATPLTIATPSPTPTVTPTPTPVPTPAPTAVVISSPSATPTPVVTTVTSSSPAPSTGTLPGVADDGRPHAPPKTGALAYYPPYGSFGPDQPGFLSVGSSYIDPVFGTSITRLSSTYPSGGSGLIYGRNGFWNANSTLYIHEFPDGKKMIDPRSGKVIFSNVPGMVADATFSPVDPDRYYYFEYDSTSIKQLTVSTGQIAVVKDFGTKLGSLGGTGNNIDNSGRYLVVNVGGTLRIFDLITATLYSGGTPADFGDGYVSIAPDGSGIAVIGGTVKRWHSIDHSSRTLSSQGTTFLTQGGDHGTLMTATNGRTYFVKPSGDDGNIHAYDVLTGTNKTLVRMNDSTPLGWCDDTHYSTIPRGPMRDWVLVDTEIYSASGGCADADARSNPDPTASWWKYRQQILMVNVLTGEIRNLAHHRGRELSRYCSTPRLNADWDGTAVMFASNYGAANGSNACGYSDLYRMSLSR